MSVARAHAEWLSLVEASGPFLSMSVLAEAFPQGLDAHDPEHARDLRNAYAEWRESQERKPDPAWHRAWALFVLRETLGYVDEVLAEGQRIPEAIKYAAAEYGETIRPDLALVNPDGAGFPRLLVQIVPAAQKLDSALSGGRWKASPATRMMELLRATDVRLALVTNGEQWMLVNSPRGETAGFVSWYAQLWLDEPATLRAFRSLLGLHRFFSVGEDARPEALLKRSAADQQEVTDQLGYQVRKAVEVLVQRIDRIDKDRNRALLEGVDEARLYEAALTVMMRLVFLFSAEERGLLMLGDELYDEHYAVSTLRAQLREAADQHGEEVLERRADAWSRLLATFRAVHGGVRHDLFNLPAYGGRLFDPNRFPFLEGRALGTDWRTTPAAPLAIDNRTVLHLLEALQVLQVKGPGGVVEARRLSFRALDVEQIGHVYEGLLDHSAIRATSPVLGLAGTKDREPEVAIETLEAEMAKGEDDLLSFLKKETGKQPQTLKKALAAEIQAELLSRLLVACDNDEALCRRVLPFLALVRMDTSGYPVVITTGSVYVTQTGDRRATGTHYTPRSLTEEVVKYALEPLVYEGVAEGRPREEWRLRSASALLGLKVCDMACGSGAFLVQACRYLADRLVEAWAESETANPGRIVVAPEGTLSGGEIRESLVPRDQEERVVAARRFVADRCLYGVDVNPMAAEMAKLSLWLVTLQKNRPFSFLDHAIRAGDSLLGVTSLEQIRHFNLDPSPESQTPLEALEFRPLVEKAVALRLELERLAGNDVVDVDHKARLFREASAALEEVTAVADLLVGEALAHSSSRKRAWRQTEEEHEDQLEAAEDDIAEMGDAVAEALAERSGLKLRDLRERVTNELRGRRPFHWALEFPEVNAFDAIVGNPPFQGGQKITGALGTDYRDYLVEHIAHGQRGSADLCAYFFLRAASVLAKGGTFGLLATNTIAQGDTREVGLDQLASDGVSIFRAIPSRPWPGTASLEVAHVWAHKGTWSSGYVLDEKTVTSISPMLVVPGKATGKPYRLKANEGKSFQGSIVLGMGFVMTPDEASRLIDKDPKNVDVLFPYLNGEDLNSRPDQSPSRWVINFRNWPLDRESAPKEYEGPVATDYPDCLKIVKEKVKPERDRNKRKERREKWWQYAEKCPALYAAIEHNKKVLARARISRTHAPALLSQGWVYNEKVVVFGPDDSGFFAEVQSNTHEVWAQAYSSTLKMDLQYTPSECCETFPFISNSPIELDQLGDAYYTERKSLLNNQQIGLTRLYSLFHSPSVTDVGYLRLRELHAAIDAEVLNLYGWSDLNPEHGFHETKFGVRFTISEAARREVLDRLLALNHERYAEEVASGLHDKKSKTQKPAKAMAKPVATKPAPSLFGESYEKAKVEAKLVTRPTPVDEIDVDDVMAAFRQAARGRGWIERTELLKAVSVNLGYQCLGSKIEDALKLHLRRAIRRGIIATDGATLVSAGTVALADYTREELQEAFHSVMRKGTRYEREDVIRSLARYLGFARLTQASRDPIKSAINGAIRRGLLDYEGQTIWRTE